MYILNMINIRERKYEIGVLRTIGMSKVKLTMQFISELMIVTLIALLLGLGIGAISAKEVSNSLLQSEITRTNKSEKEVQENFGGKMPDGDKNSSKSQSNFSKNGPNISAYQSIDAVVDIKVILELLAISLGLVLVSSLASMISIQHFSPLTILKERSQMKKREQTKEKNNISIIPSKKENKVLLKIENASYRYKDAKKDEYAIKNINYEFEQGKTYAIKGRSGSGKTTLLSLISGLERCSEGRIIFNHKDLNQINLDTYRNHEIGIVFQSYNLLTFMSTIENIILSMDISGIKIEDKKKRALELMKQVGLKESYATRKILKLSGGEQQRVAIARSLSYCPKMIITDEPTGNLDKETEKEILDIFKKLAHEENKCIIIVTHSKEVCEMVDEVYELKKGK